MSKIQAYFSSVPDSHRIYLLGGTILICWLIENFVPVVNNYKKGKHSMVNALFIFPAAPVQFLLGVILAKIIIWDTAHSFGFLNMIPGFTNPWVLFIATFLVLDLFEYCYHVIMHKVKALWMFHVVHHSDQVCDATTTLREHPGETFVRLSFLCLFVFISGACFWALLFRQFIQIASNVFVHSNFKLPAKLEKITSYVFVTPTLHHVHHHYKQPFTDTNYGDVLIIWDRIFGTYSSLKDKDIVVGIDTYPEERETGNFIKLMLMPFGKYRQRPE